MEEENMESKKPLLVVFAGPNGSGKSTIVEHFGLLEGYTNADDVVYSTEMTNYEAAQYVYERRNKYLSELKNFSFETVLSSDYSMDIIRKAHEKGYFIKCIFVLLALLCNKLSSKKWKDEEPVSFWIKKKNFHLRISLM